MKFNITQCHYATPFLESFWGILSETTELPQKQFILIERIKDFLELYSPLDPVMCNAELIRLIHIFLPAHETQILPTDFQSLFSSLPNKPVWLLAGADMSNSLIACKIEKTENELTVYFNHQRKEGDALMILDHQQPPKCKHRFDLRHLPFSAEQKMLLSLLGGVEILRSVMFSCSAVALGSFCFIERVHNSEK